MMMIFVYDFGIGGIDDDYRARFGMAWQVKANCEDNVCEETFSPFIIQYVLRLCVTVQAEQGQV